MKTPQVTLFITMDPIRDGNNWYTCVQNNPVNLRDLWGLECQTGNDREDAVNQKVTNVRVETSGFEINLLSFSIGDTSLPVTGGVLNANFYLNDSTTPSFTAEYYYYVSSKQGFEVTIGGGSIIAGTGYKTFYGEITAVEIARDFTSAGTISNAGGFSSTVGAGVSYSSSGGWDYSQFSIGGSITGSPLLYVIEHTNTFLKKDSEKQLERTNQ